MLSDEPKEEEPVATITLHRPVRARETDWEQWGLPIIVGGCALIALIGAVVYPRTAELWHPMLARPDWVPDWAFGPVWPAVYAAMAAAASFVWRAREREEVCFALSAFGVLLVVNLVWCVSFFALQSALLGFLTVCVMWVLTAVATAEFFRVSRTAGALMLPFCTWVTFAAVANAAILILGG